MRDTDCVPRARAISARPDASDKTTIPPRAAQSARAMVQRKAACACGGTCPACLAASARPLSRPGDAMETEADRVADHVMRAGNSSAPPAIANGASATVSRSAGSGAAAAPGHAGELGLSSGGTPLDAGTRAFMEPRLGQDLGQVRLHTDDSADASARSLSARAYTLGNDIVFSKGQYDPQSTTGGTLLAHELAHVLQQRQGATGIQRDVTPEYALIEDRLTYGLFDWAITDGNCLDVLNLLATLSDADLADTVAAMDRDGLLDRLMENISEDDQQVFAVLIGRINRHRSVSHTGDWIISQLSYGAFDWAITDDDATRAFMVLRGLESQELRSVIAKMVNAGVYDRLRDQLPEELVGQFAAFMTRLDDIRDEFNALVDNQVDFFRNQKDETGAPISAGAVISQTVKDTGYGGAPATWDDLKPDEKKVWRRRAADAIAAVKASAVGTQLDEVLKRGELVFIPEEAEKNSAYAYVSGTNKLYFGREWVRDAEKDPKNVWQSIAHELGGHEEFGDTWSWAIMQAALARLTPDERAKALSGSNHVFSAYGYLETELYAELRELPHRVPGSGGDRPQDDVPAQLRKIKKAFSEQVALQIVIRLYYRVALDPRVTDEAKSLFYRSVQDVFGLFPIAGNVAP